jgi:hypothetical protein
MRVNFHFVGVQTASVFLYVGVSTVINLHVVSAGISDVADRPYTLESEKMLFTPVPVPHDCY